MRTTKLFLVMFLIFFIKTFSQNPIIDDVNFCTGSSSSQTISVKNPLATATYVWEVKTSTTDWTKITMSNAGSFYKDYNTSVLNITRSISLPATLTKYRVIETFNSISLTSNEASLIVNPLPIVKTITGASPICTGGDETLVYGSGSVGVIQWQSSTTSSTTDFNDVDFENSTVYNAKKLEETTWFRVMNTSGACNPIYSPAVQVIVNSLSIAGDINGGDVNVCKTLNSTELTLYNQEGSVAWQKSTSINGPYSPIVSANSELFKANALTTNTYFRALVTNGVCPSVTSVPVYINVDAPSESKSILGAKVLCVGNDITLNYELGSIGEIQWQFSTTSNSPDDFIDIDTSNSLAYTEKDLQETTWYRVMNTSGECSPSYSPVVQVTVNPLAEAGEINELKDHVCYLTNSTPLILNNSEGNIQWQKASDVLGSPSTFTNIGSATKEIYTAASLTATTHYRAVLTSGVCPTQITNYVTVFVDPLPVVKSISGASPTCIGGSKVLVYGSESIGDIRWQSSVTSNLADFSNISEENSEVYLASDINETTWFRVSNTSGVCNPKYSPVVKVDVNPPPVSGLIEVGNTLFSNKSNSTELTLKNYSGDIQWQKSISQNDSFVDIVTTSPKYIVSDLKDTTYFRAIVSNSCSRVVSDPVKISVETELNVTIYPNPFRQDFNVNIIQLSNDSVDIKVFDLLGKKVDIQNVESSKINSTVFGSSYLPGFYTILFRQGQLEKTIKVLKK